MDREAIEALVERIRAGEQRAWNELVAVTQRRVFAAALAAAKDPQDADEATQEAFVRLFHHIASIREPAAVPAWLIRAACNVVRDRQRWRRVRGWFGGGTREPDEAATAHPSPEEAASRHERERLFADWARARLSERERVVLQLHVGEEMTFAEVGNALGCSTSSAKTYFARAKAKLAPLVEREGGHD